MEGEPFVFLLAANVLLAAMFDGIVGTRGGNGDYNEVFFLFFFAVQRCTTTSVPENSSVSHQGGEGRGADGCPGQVRHRRYRREAVLVPAKDGVDDHHYKSVFFLMCDWINRLDPLLAPQRLSSARNQHVDMTSHICCCVQGQVQVTCGLSLMVR